MPITIDSASDISRPVPERIEAARKKGKLPKPKADRIKPKADPALIAKARELRDRWLERVNAHGLELIAGKYDVARLAA